MNSIICSGFGGQGILTAGLILAKISMDGGKQVSWVPSYGSEMRGGTASCAIKVSDTEIYSPFIKEMNTLVAMNEASVDQFESLVKPGGVLISNSTIIQGRTFRSDIKVVEVAATAISEELKNIRGANLVMLGAMIQATGLFAPEFFADGIDAYFDAKGRNTPLNRECYMAGVTAAGQA
jgi:2-oxoglutarate ferredoxin oxidoreductase subunit gamma